MKIKTVAGLIAIVVITAAVVFTGCIESVKIKDILEQPEEYVDKEVTVIGSVSDVSSGFNLSRGFRVTGSRRDGGGSIWVDCTDYDGNNMPMPIPGDMMVTVTGVVRVRETIASNTTIFIEIESFDVPYQQT